jgi:hypothetical protein
METAAFEPLLEMRQTHTATKLELSKELRLITNPLSIVYPRISIASHVFHPAPETKNARARTHLN